MAAKVLMFQGTGSDVGKSTVVAGLCRLASQRGIRVAPFKPQNMSNNAAACDSGGEIGRAQALQAVAAGLPPQIDFNPVLLKPQTDQSAQVVVHGEVLDTISASDYMNRRRAHLLNAVTDSFWRLCDQYELLLVEGAGSASEINLRRHDIANMGFARRVNAPVCLIGDIDRGGVIASIAGTQKVIDRGDARLIRSFLINRFRGDPRLFDDGITAIEQHTHWPCRGVIPWLPAATRLPQEDAVILEHPSELDKRERRTLRIAVPMLSRIANFDDLDPLRAEPNVDVSFIPPGRCLPQQADAIILPGTKSTLGDLQFLREQGWDHDIIAFARSGKRIMGICGGYQLLGTDLHDPNRVDGTTAYAAGLGLLNVTSTMQATKQTRTISGVCARSQCALQGYEIHMGTTRGIDTQRPLAHLDGTADGAISDAGNVEGTYLHGIFANDAFRSWWLEQLRPGTSSHLQYHNTLESDLNRLAADIESALDIDQLFGDAAVPARGS